MTTATTSLTDIEWESCLLTPVRAPEAESYAKSAMGVVPPLVPYYSACPWVVRSIVELNGSQMPLAHTDADFERLISLVVAQENSCRFCYAASRALLKIFGFREIKLRRVEQDLQTAELSDRIRVGLEFVRRVARANPLPGPEERRKLGDVGFSPDAAAELAFLGGVHVFFNRLSTLPALPTDSIERMAFSSWIPLLRPLIVRFILPKRLKRNAAPDPKSYDGPFAYLPRALATLPIAATLADRLRDAWAPSSLSRRTKALMFALVARGLDCAISEQEALRVLESEGLSQNDSKTILEHLSSPLLDSTEALLVPYARETIWFRPAQIQRRTRALHAALPTEQFVEALGVAALANAVCRMNTVLDRG